MYLSAGDTRRGIAYDYQTSWLEPFSLITESNPYASDTTVHVLAVYNENLMGYTLFNAHHKSTWKPNLLSITREDAADEDRPWITGQVLAIIDEIQTVSNLILTVEQMIKDYPLKKTLTETACRLIIPPPYGEACVYVYERYIKDEQTKYINAWKNNFSVIHNEKTQYVLSKLNGTTVTLNESKHAYLLTKSEDQCDPNRLKRLRFKHENSREKDIFYQVNLSTTSLSESALKEFRIYNQNLLDFSSEMLGHPLIDGIYCGRDSE